MPTDTISQGLTPLRAHRILIRAALGLGMCFAWIWVLQYFYEMSGDLSRSLAAVAICYALAQGISMFLAPIAAAHLRGGCMQSMVWGLFALASAFTMLGATSAGIVEHAPVGWGVACFAILLGVYRALYVVPYALQVEESPRTRFRAHVFFDVALALLPAFAGLTLATVSSPERLFFGVAAIALLSIVPVLMLGDIREKFSWSYHYTFAQLFREKHRVLVMHSFLAGIEGAALLFVWPIAAFIVLDFSYAALGVVFSASLLLLLATRFLYRAFLKRHRISDPRLLTSIAIIGGWIARFSVGTPYGLIAADVFAYTAYPVRSIRTDPSTHEHAADGGSFIDEYTTLKELALTSGRLFAAALLGVLTLALPLAYAFGALLFFAAASGTLTALGDRYANPTEAAQG